MLNPQRIEPGPGQESVWDYPRPPRVEDTHQHVVVEFNGVVIAETRRARRVLETSHPPVYYLPPEDVRMEYLSLAGRQTYCEFKGAASYYTVAIGRRVEVAAAWFYPEPRPGYEAIANYIAFYPSRMDACYVDGERVTPQPGDFYGGWITSAVVGPFKGEPGTWGW
jgi:uncharacterized protein (DUF427 family)